MNLLRITLHIYLSKQ